MSEKIKALNEKIEKEIRPSEVRQHYILFKNAEFEIIKKAEREMKEQGIYGKSRVLAVACLSLLEKLKEENGKKS